jgi:hypothetical protein
MTTTLTIEQFRSRLRNLTSIGKSSLKESPFSVLTIYDPTDKPFFGQISDTRFRLTKNSSFLPIPFVISGDYKHTETSETIVNYKIQPVWFGYRWIKILPVMVFVLINVLLIRSASTLPIDLLIAVNIFLLFMCSPIVITNLQKRRMEMDFLTAVELTK